jgi:hypothetical protein
MKGTTGLLEPKPLDRKPPAKVDHAPARPVNVSPAVVPATAVQALPKTANEVMAVHSAVGNSALARAANATSRATPISPLQPSTTSAASPAAAAPLAAVAPVAHGESRHAAGNKAAGSAAKAAPVSMVHSVMVGAKAGAAQSRTPAGKPEAPAKSLIHGKTAHDTKAPAAARAAMVPVIHAIQHRATGARKHSPAAVPIASADAAGKVAGTEQARSAAVQSVANLTAAKTEPVKRNDFKTKLKQAIEQATPKPKTESEADDVVKSGGTKASATLRGQLSTQKDEAAGPLKSAALPQSDVSPSSEPAPPMPDLVPEPLGSPPAPVAAGAAVPGALPAERLDYSSDRDPTDRAMAESGVTHEQLEKGNEPEFQQNLSARAAVEKHEASVEGHYRQSEATVRGQTENAAHTQIANGLGNIHGARAQKVAMVVGQQLATAAKHAQERQQVTDKINAIKNDTRKDVELTLTSMEEDAGKIFDNGLQLAEKAYQDTFDDAKGGVGTWLTTWGSDWKDLIESSLGKARQAYLAEVDIAIDQVADLVDARLDTARRRVERGRTDVENLVKGLHGNLAKFGADALKSVEGDFAQMSGEIDQRRDELIDKLTQEYKASYDRMSAMEEKLRAENQSLWDRIYDATVGLIKKILAFKDMLLSVLSRAADAIGTIIAHPISFLGNLVEAGKQGFSNFVGHILEHLKVGFMEWLFGAVAATGIQLPKNFDLEGILSLVLQILGLTYSNIRSRAVKILGEKVVKALETAAEIFKILITKGPVGLWDHIKEKLGDLQAMVIEKIKAFIMEKVVMAGVTWIIGLLNPASAFFKACKAIYDIVMFFIEHGQQILDVVNAIIDSITSIARGAIGAAADFVEASLARSIPVIIGFLAALLGVGGISEKIKEVIEAVRKPINEAIDWVITKAVGLVKAVGGLLGFGKKEDKETNKDLSAAQAAAREAVMARFSNGANEDEIEASLPGILAELGPMGLKSLTVGPLDKDDAREILAESSPKLRVAKIIAKRVIVEVTAEITMREAHKGEFKLSGLFKDDENPDFVDYSPMKIKPKQKTESDQEFEERARKYEVKKENRMEAIGGTGRAALLPALSQPPKTPAKYGDQAPGGLIVEPKEGTHTFDVLTWNTSKFVPGSNVSHAETQFVEWFENRPNDWLMRVEALKVRVRGQEICPECTELKIGFEKRMESKWPKMKVSFLPYDPKEEKAKKVE